MARYKYRDDIRGRGRPYCSRRARPAQTLCQLAVGSRFPGLYLRKLAPDLQLEISAANTKLQIVASGEGIKGFVQRGLYQAIVLLNTARRCTVQRRRERAKVPQHYIHTGDAGRNIKPAQPVIRCSHDTLAVRKLRISPPDLYAVIPVGVAADIRAD